MAHPQTEVADIYLQHTTHYLPRKDERLSRPGWLTYSGRFTQYPHKWSPVSRRSRAGQRKFACQRPTFYHCAMQPTSTRRATGFGGYICFFIHLPVVYRVWESIVETMFKPKSGRKVDSGVWTYSCMMRRPTKVVERVFSVCGDLQVLS